MEKTILFANKLGKTYRTKKAQVKALRDVCIAADEQEIIGLMGASGCGKTTFAKIVAGIEPLTSGELELFGQDCSKGVPDALKQRIGLIYQDSNLLPWRSVESNLRFPLEIFGRAKGAGAQKRIRSALETVGLYEYRDCLPQELSGGMIQRVGIARALVIDPDLMVMDQPFGALDVITRKKLYFDFLNIFRKTQKTILIITNSIDEALLFSRRVYVMGEAPGTVEHTVSVDIPYEERTPAILKDERFLDLRRQMIRLVKEQFDQEKREA